MKDLYQNCRNCNNRFSCDEQEKHKHCDKYVYDPDAATCCDCALKDECEDYHYLKPTCENWKIEPTCDECVKNLKCKKYQEGGKVCKKFKEIKYKLSEKGLLYVALTEVTGIDKMWLDTETILAKGFFEDLEHEMKINGLIHDTKFGLFMSKIKYFILRVLNITTLSPTMYDIFTKIAKSEKYFFDFGLSENGVNKAYERYALKLLKYNKQ